MRSTQFTILAALLTLFAAPAFAGDDCPYFCPAQPGGCSVSCPCQPVLTEEGECPCIRLEPACAEAVFADGFEQGNAGGWLTGPAYDWSLTGQVVYVIEIPNSGGAWAVTIQRIAPEVGGEEYLLVICDHEQDVTAACADLELFDEIAVAGFVRSNEPSSGQRLTVRELVHVP